jgi:NADH dehydrogenase FAD-containing subunit
LLQLGVELRLEKAVQSIDADCALVGDERISSKTVIWTAGVAPSPAGKWLGCDVDRAGRVRVREDLTIQDHPEIYVVGDTATLDQGGRRLPGVAQVAIQQGRYAGQSIIRQSARKAPLPPFSYFDKGDLAVVGKGFAVLQSGHIKTSGFFAWLVWALVHIQFLAESSLRFSVFFQWVRTYLSGQRGDRLIIEKH